MYLAGFIIPVPEQNLAAYKTWSERSSQLLTEYGCLHVMETWEDYVPDGQHTDFRRAVNAQPDEKIVFSWQVWPDKAALEAAERAMSEDPRFDPPGGPPFDQKRLIMGCFTPLSDVTAV